MADLWDDLSLPADDFTTYHGKLQLGMVLQHDLQSGSAKASYSLQISPGTACWAAGSAVSTIGKKISCLSSTYSSTTYGGHERIVRTFARP